MAACPAGFMFPSPGKVALDFMVLSIAVLGPTLAYQEANGENARFSKFASSVGRKKKEEEDAAMIASKTGMFLIYFPAALLATAFLECRLGILPLAALLDSSSSSWWFGASGAASSSSSFWESALVADGAGDHRLLLVAVAMFLHFSKRVLEVLFIHNYSGSICVHDIAHISLSYATQVCFLLYSQLLSAAAQGSATPFPQNLKWLGVAFYLIGITGNAYHHWLLSRLRDNSDGNNAKVTYVVPHGGFFGRLVCPHYVFEMIEYMGIAFISQTLFSVCMVWFVVWYLTGRAVVTKKWYAKKMEGFPGERNVLIPGIL